MTNIVTSVTQSSGRSFKVTVENTKPLIGVSISGRGPQGEEGKSAYDLWIESGKTGTMEEFLQTMVPAPLETFVHDQIPPAFTWEIVHALNRLPSVTVVDSGGNVVMGDIIYIDENSLSISFTVAFSGKVYLN